MYLRPKAVLSCRRETFESFKDSPLSGDVLGKEENEDLGYNWPGRNICTLKMYTVLKEMAKEKEH